MTEMQIAYRNLQESRRHNRAVEKNEADKLAETVRSNQAREAETYRTNVVNEALKRQANVINQSYYTQQAAETHRSNVADERIRSATQAEVKRSNIAKESENSRHNQAVENETRRSNVINESYKSSSLSLDNQLKKEQLKSAKIENKYKEANVVSGLLKTGAQTAESGINSITNILRSVGQVVNMAK